MSHTKTIIIPTNWLSDIDGLTVAAAIEYLKTLDQRHTLSCYMAGDTHGCEIVSRLEYDVPMTNAEVLAKLEKHYGKEIALYESAKRKHLEEGKTERASNCDRLLSQLYTKLADARSKYGA